MWHLLLITLVAWRKPEENQFPQHDPNLCEAAKFTSLWATKDPNYIMEINICWVLFESDLRMVINEWPRLSPRLNVQYVNIVDFKANFHNLLSTRRNISWAHGICFHTWSLMMILWGSSVNG